MDTQYRTPIGDIEELDGITSDRKLKHLQICLEHDVQARKVSTGLDDISFIHRATTDLNLRDIDISTEIFGKKLEIPLIVSGMTGGHDFSYKLNHLLSDAVSRTKIGMGVGSQRAALENQELKESFTIVRSNAPKSLIIGNIGAAQVALGLSKEQIHEIIDMIDATALAIHFNPLQEAIQPEGDTNLNSLHEKIRELSKDVDIPLIAKEVGSGFSIDDVHLIKELGLNAIDIQGVGGTSWAGVESIRAVNNILKKTGEIFWDWGIPTAVSTILARNNFDGVIIGSGGVRNGLDIAKLIALGADAGGMAIPFLFITQNHSTDLIVEFIEEIAYQIRLTCFLTGASNLKELQKVPILITGKTAEILRNYGLDPSIYLKRCE
ncbi:MAG: type 2 isopentenyl-diphosphate Delta-isomerase [Candidatus Hodarchaeales archaeon]